MSLTSEAPFSPSVKNQIREIFDYRCVICLNSVFTSQCAHILDAATAGQQQVLNASELGILLGDYDRNAAPNGMIQCPTCHSYFTANTIVLSLPIPLLKYLQRYVTYTSKANRKSLHEVFSLLMDASLGTAVDLPDVNPVLPYIGLFTVVTLNPALVTGYWLVTPYLPSMSTIRGSNFVEAPSSTLPTAENAARIFHSNAINNDTPLRYGKIPLSPQNENFAEMRYWRLPVSAAPIFAALIARLGNDSSKCEDIRLAKNIQSILVLQQNNAYPLDVAGPSGSGPGGGGGGGGDDGPGGGGGGSGGGPGGGGPGGGGGSKRKETTRSPSSRKSNKRGRKASGGGGETHDCGNESARSQTGQPHHREITASSRSMEAPVELIDAGWNDTDSEGGRSVSSVNPHGKDDPAKWMFSPSFSTNKNVLIARAVNLTL